MQGDVAALDPADFAPCDLLIASPPCQAWSVAGKRQGQLDIERVYALTDAVAQGFAAPHGDEWADDRSRLVTEPLRWALALRPRFIALEQVPPVLDYWRHVAGILRAYGYRTWVGILSAERYGVPQTRKRAILMASREGPVSPPAPTHQAYRPGQPAQGEDGLFGSLEPWVSMAQALGRDEAWATGHETARGAGMTERHGERRVRPASEPSEHVTSKVRSWSVRTNNFSAVERDKDGARSKRGSVPYERPVDGPAPTVDTHAQGWTLRNGTQANACERPADEPAGTLFFGHQMNDVSWVGERNADDEAAGREYDGRAGENAIRVSLAEAAILQGFPPDYPFAGSRTKQFEQVGNAIPPPLARAILSELVHRA